MQAGRLADGHGEADRRYFGTSKTSLKLISIIIQKYTYTSEGGDTRFF
jgi:hypothetical protein